MLRTSLRKANQSLNEHARKFLSSNAQDFIEDAQLMPLRAAELVFLSSNAQDFIEDVKWDRRSQHDYFIPEQ